MFCIDNLVGDVSSKVGYMVPIYNYVLLIFQEVGEISLVISYIPRNHFENMTD